METINTEQSGITILYYRTEKKVNKKNNSIHITKIRKNALKDLKSVRSTEIMTAIYQQFVHRD